ncbi:hypothetical protein ATO12_12650 [Aquimarina atlantica]|uniref:VOC domain-containing protein n=2 Tax=Aquimarina atlantica TaxID=1317122 RepID=A0A023BXE6_9FLAO|nr:hypothetical protein ATO12_12650 [Aquimarina atlantica]
MSGQEIKPMGAAIVVNDIDKATDWYKKVFQVEVSNEMNFPEYDSLQIKILKNDAFQLELLQKKTAFSIKKFIPNYSVNNQPLLGIYKMVFKTSELEKLHLRLQKLDVNIILGLTSDEPNRLDYFIISDPDGNIIQFIEPKVEVLTLDIDKTTIPEGIVIHPETEEIFISSIHLDRITKSDENGENSSIILSNENCGYTIGVGMEIYKNQLYALGSFNRKKISKLFIKNLNDTIVQCISLKNGKPSYFNDLAVDDNGNAYITDTDSHHIYRYDVQRNEITTFLANKQIQYPNGITISPDNTKLFIDSYSHGIRIVDIKTKKILNQIHQPTAKRGIDGLKYYNGDLYAIVNGGKNRTKHGLYKISVSEKEDDILNVEPVLVNHPKMDIPTTVSIRNKTVYILANSQLLNLNQDKNVIIDPDKLHSVVVIKVKLD